MKKLPYFINLLFGILFASQVYCQIIPNYPDKHYTVNELYNYKNTFYPPINDECEGAISLSCGESHAGSTLFATDSGANVANDVFYKFTSTDQPEMVTVSLCGANYDTTLRVFTDCSLSNEIAFNDDSISCGFQSELSFLSDGISTYYIMVEGFGVSMGDYIINITCAEPPAYTCVENFVNSNNFENGLFFGGDNNQRLAVDIIVGDTEFTVYGVKLNLFVDGNTDLTFNANFYTNDEGIPGAEHHSTTTTVEEFTWIGNALGYDIYEYIINFEANVLLNSNTTYWMEIETNGFAWEATYGNFIGGGLSFMNTGTSNEWINVLITDLVYELICDDLSISDVNSFDFSYYPNPTKDLLNISTKKEIKDISIFNLTGQQVLKSIHSETNLSSLKTGTYIFRVTLDGGQIETFKIIKK